MQERQAIDNHHNHIDDSSTAADWDYSLLVY